MGALLPSIIATPWMRRTAPVQQPPLRTKLPLGKEMNTKPPTTWSTPGASRKSHSNAQSIPYFKTEPTHHISPSKDDLHGQPCHRTLHMRLLGPPLHKLQPTKPLPPTRRLLTPSGTTFPQHPWMTRRSSFKRQRGGTQDGNEASRDHSSISGLWFPACLIGCTRTRRDNR